MGSIKLAVFDVAGTTAKDDGLVVQAFQDAISASGYSSQEVAEMTKYVNATMGQRKIDVFTHLCNGDGVKAEAMHEDFVSSYNSLVTRGFLEEFEGVTEFFGKLRAAGVGIGITTGFPREILAPILKSLHWNEIIDVSVAASEVGQGRPAPDMIFKCISEFSEKIGEEISAANVAVIGDTPSDIQSGLAAGAALVIGVTSGAFSHSELEGEFPTHIFEFSTSTLELLLA